MRRLLFRRTTLLIIIIFILSMITGCKPNKNSTVEKTGVIPTEQAQNYIDDNNRTNLVNSGFICEDAQYIYYKNSSDRNSLYRLDKKTNEKIKLAEAYNRMAKLDSTTNELRIIGVTDGKVYYITGDPEASAIDTKGSFSALYKVDVDGANKEKIISDIKQNCIICNGYAYYSLRSELNNLYRVNLDTKNTELFINGSTDMNVINESGDKMYFIRSETEPVGKSIYEFDMYTKNEKKLLTAPGLALGQGQGISFLNYYKGMLYYVENSIIKKYDLTYNVIETISKRPDETSLINAFVVSHLGIFFFAGNTLYNTEGAAATAITTINDKKGEYGVGLTDNHIIITNNKSGVTKDSGTYYFKTFNLDGSEVTLGF